MSYHHRTSSKIPGRFLEFGESRQRTPLPPGSWQDRKVRLHQIRTCGNPLIYTNTPMDCTALPDRSLLQRHRWCSPQDIQPCRPSHRPGHMFGVRRKCRCRSLRLRRQHWCTQRDTHSCRLWWNRGRTLGLWQCPCKLQRHLNRSRRDTHRCRPSLHLDHTSERWQCPCSSQRLHRSHNLRDTRRCHPWRHRGHISRCCRRQCPCSSRQLRCRRTQVGRQPCRRCQGPDHRPAFPWKWRTLEPFQCT